MKDPSTLIITLVIFGTLALSPLVSADQPPTADNSTSQLIESLGCRGCHRIQGFGGNLAADLTTIGTRLTTAEIAEVLITHQPDAKSTLMPSYSTLNAEEIDALSSYLYHLR